MPAYRGMEYLRRKLRDKTTRVNLRYDYYEMKDMHTSYSPVIPQNLKKFYKSTLGWCTTAVDSIADRLIFREFANDNFYLNEIFNMNNSDILYDSLILSALIASCSFIYISAGTDGYPRMQVLNARNATGIIDPVTGLLQEGYAVLKRDEYGAVEIDAYFTAESTKIFRRRKGTTQDVPNYAPYPLLVPVIYRPDDKRPFGHSRISRACMYLQRFAKRSMERADITADFYSFPQKYVLGLSNDAERMEKWAATISSLLQFDKDKDGDSPKVGQFQQVSMAPHLDQLKTAATMFAGETGLTVEDLGFVSENPSSSEAIKASHESLRLKAIKAQRTFGTGLLNAGYLAACVRDKKAYERFQFYKTVPKWEPIFIPDAAALTTIGDGVVKINTAIPGYVGKDNIRDLTGIEASEES